MAGALSCWLPLLRRHQRRWGECRLRLVVQPTLAAWLLVMSGTQAYWLLVLHICLPVLPIRLPAWDHEHFRRQAGKEGSGWLCSNSTGHARRQAARCSCMQA